MNRALEPVSQTETIDLRTRTECHEVIRTTKSMEENDINDLTIGSRLDVDRLPAHGYANSRINVNIGYL